jgi:hypothetical protein
LRAGPPPQARKSLAAGDPRPRAWESNPAQSVSQTEARFRRELEGPLCSESNRDDRDRNPERGSPTTERTARPRLAGAWSAHAGALARSRTEPSGLEDPRRDPPGRAQGDADASRTRPRGFAIRAHHWVPASQSGQRVMLPQCSSGTRASSLSDWPHRSGRRESNTLHRVGGPRSDHQTAPAHQSSSPVSRRPDVVTKDGWPLARGAVEPPRVALGLRQCERRR